MKTDIKIFNNIIFIGGIHGVGKSTICQKLANDLKVEYLSASEVLKWQDLNVDAKNKLVKDISNTQERLIKGLQAIINRDKHYILDGHFCLFNKDGVAAKVPSATFHTINPIHLVVFAGDPIKISEGLKSRDQKSYSEHTLANMQALEIEYAEELAIKLSTPLVIFDVSQYDLNYNHLLSQLHESLT